MSAPLAEVTVDSVPPIQTNRLRYALRGDDRAAFVDVDAIYRNRHSRTVYLAHCGAGFERLVGGKWQPVADDSVCPLVDRPPTPIRPGAQHRSRHGMYFNMGRGWSPSWDSLPGTYRLVYRLSFDPEVEGTSERNPALLPKAARVSNAFEVMPLLSDLPITLPPPPREEPTPPGHDDLCEVVQRIALIVAAGGNHCEA
ncbi:hypothetical protein BH23GEM7_BH23GEM7_35080 [soil metagenome]